VGLSEGRKEQDRQLGMSYGNACHRLRCLLLFKYVKKAGENFCFVCGEEIKTYDEFSIEHKIPWLHNGSDLFWDFGNIAFSHRWCNKPHRQRSGFTKEQCKKALKTKIKKGVAKPTHNKKGQYWCWCCKSYKDASEFVRNRRNKTRDGLSSECRPCKAKLRRKSQ
jgi:hypothetical protein